MTGQIQLTDQDILLSHSVDSKEAALKDICNILYINGYITDKEAFYDAMLERESQTTTYLESGVAIPHPTRESSDLIKKPGLVVLQLTKGVTWDKESEEQAQLILGVCAIGDAHMEVLQRSAELFSNESLLNNLLSTGNKEDFLNYFN